MEVTIEKGTHRYFVDCEEALINSDLGKYYFKKKGSTHSIIEEGLNAGTLYVALVQDKCVGFMFYMPNGAFHSFPYLHLIAIKKEYRGLGIGKLLMDYWEQVADSSKYFLLVADFNHDAKRLYENLGYRQVGELKGLYNENVTEYIMMKEKSTIQ